MNEKNSKFDNDNKNISQTIVYEEKPEANILNNESLESSKVENTVIKEDE